MKLHAVIFDLDGTLLDTLKDLTAAVDHALVAFGMPPIDIAKVREFVGNGVPKLIERAINFVTKGTSDGACDYGLTAAVLATFTEYYDVHNADLTAPYDGVEEMLEGVKAAGLKTAIVTNKYDKAAQELKKRFFGGVDVLIGSRRGISPKPAPDGVYKALEILGVDKSAAVYIGDGETDMNTAKNAGLPAVAVTWGFRDRNVLAAFSPDFMISSPSELMPALRGAGLIG